MIVSHGRLNAAVTSKHFPVSTECQNYTVIHCHVCEAEWRQSLDRILYSSSADGHHLNTEIHMCLQQSIYYQELSSNNYYKTSNIKVPKTPSRFDITIQIYQKQI